MLMIHTEVESSNWAASAESPEVFRSVHGIAVARGADLTGLDDFE
jgi:hypothetical protein